MQNNDWFRLIVPGALFLIWIVNQLLNKEIKPNLNPAERPVGAGPRPGGPPPAPRTSPRDPRDPTMRFTNTSTARQGPVRSAADDDIIVIRAEPTKFSASSTSSGASKQSARQKSAPAKMPAASSRLLTPGVTQKLSSTLDHHSLVEEHTSLLLSMPPAVSTGLGITPSPTALELFKTFGSQQAMREAFLINELLQPPLSMRRNHRR
ncbi:MAG: hypothetical protein ABI353_17800 [Isosphaeraceae bacterium]